MFGHAYTFSSFINPSKNSSSLKLILFFLKADLKQFSKKLFDYAFGDPRLTTDNKGPGEAALAILSPKIQLCPLQKDFWILKPVAFHL